MTKELLDRAKNICGLYESVGIMKYRAFLIGSSSYTEPLFIFHNFDLETDEISQELIIPQEHKNFLDLIEQCEKRKNLAHWKFSPEYITAEVAAIKPTLESNALYEWLNT
jgi:hypothetical protein